MKKIRGALRRLRAKTRGLIRRGGDGGGAPPKDGGGDTGGNDNVLWQLASFATAITASVAVSAGLTLCETGAIYDMTPFGPSCARGSQIAGNVSVGAGVGFVVFLVMEVIGMVFAQIYRDRQRRESAELRAEVAELKVEVAEQSRRAEVAELSRRLDVSELSRRAEAAELKTEAAELKAEAAEQSRRAEAERAARLELELERATRNAAKNGDGESG